MRLSWAVSIALPVGLSRNGGHGSIEESEIFNLSLHFHNVFDECVLAHEVQLPGSNKQIWNAAVRDTDAWILDTREVRSVGRAVPGARCPVVVQVHTPDMLPAQSQYTVYS